MLGQITPAGGPTGTAAALGSLTGEGFLKLLVAQLRYQNPMAPTDPAAMLQQTSQLAQMENLQQVLRLQQQLLGLQQASIAADLVGTSITAKTDDGQPVEGVVDAVRFTTSGPVLVVGDHEVPVHAAVELRGTTP